MTLEMQKRDVILTIVHRASFAYVATFLESLHRTGYAGEIIFFVSALEEESIIRLRAQGVTVIPFHFNGKKIKPRLASLWPAWRLIFRSRLAPGLKERLAHLVLPLFYRRHLLYLQYLRAHRQNYDRILLTDARDVFFQTDPFSWNPPPGVHIFLEDAKIAAGGLNSRWIASQFGQPAAETMADKTVACVGTVFGDMAGILHYLETMVSLIINARNVHEEAGDQGIHNYLLHRQPPPQVAVHDNRTGPVLTMGLMNPQALRFAADGSLVNDRGLVFPVLHQFDRLPDVEKMLRARVA